MFVIGIISCYFNEKVNMDINVYGNIFLYYISFISSTIGMLLLVKFIFKYKNNYLNKININLFKNVGMYTLFYLGYQKFLIVLLKKIIVVFKPYSLYSLLIAVLTFLLLYPISYLVYKYVPFVVGKFSKIK